jgi:tRNA (mo5U34)-methyltransferase
MSIDQTNAFADLKDVVQKYLWFHSIDLGNGVITPGVESVDVVKRKAAALFDGVDIRNKTFLDVGACNGGLCVEAARRGAKRIVGLDQRWRETFDLVSKVLKLNFEAVDIDLNTPQLDLSFMGSFDIVLFSGVFYHLVDPIAATREVSSLARELLILESHIEVIEGDRRPGMIFYPSNELSGVSSNWWGPNVECIVALLRHFGFERIELRDYADTRKVFRAYKPNTKQSLT